MKSSVAHGVKRPQIESTQIRQCVQHFFLLMRAGRTVLNEVQDVAHSRGCCHFRRTFVIDQRTRVVALGVGVHIFTVVTCHEEHMIIALVFYHHQFVGFFVDDRGKFCPATGGRRQHRTHNRNPFLGWSDHYMFRHFAVQRLHEPLLRLMHSIWRLHQRHTGHRERSHTETHSSKQTWCQADWPGMCEKSARAALVALTNHFELGNCPGARRLMTAALTYSWLLLAAVQPQP